MPEGPVCLLPFRSYKNSWGAATTVPPLQMKKQGKHLVQGTQQETGFGHSLAASRTPHLISLFRHLS